MQLAPVKRHAGLRQVKPFRGPQQDPPTSRIGVNQLPKPDQGSSAQCRRSPCRSVEPHCDLAGAP